MYLASHGLLWPLLLFPSMMQSTWETNWKSTCAILRESAGRSPGGVQSTLSIILILELPLRQSDSNCWRGKARSPCSTSTSVLVKLGITTFHIELSSSRGIPWRRCVRRRSKRATATSKRGKYQNPCRNNPGSRPLRPRSKRPEPRKKQRNERLTTNCYATGPNERNTCDCHSPRERSSP